MEARQRWSRVSSPLAPPRRWSPAAFDYVAGGAWDEITLAENEAAWRRRRSAAGARRRQPDRPLDDDARRRRPCRSRSRRWPPTALAHPGRRARDRASGGRGGDPVHLFDGLDRVDRGGRRGRARRHALVPALHPGRSGPDQDRSSSARRRPAMARSSSRSTCRSSAIASAIGGPGSTCRPHGNFADGGPTHADHGGDATAASTILEDGAAIEASTWDDLATIRSLDAPAARPQGV